MKWYTLLLVAVLIVVYTVIGGVIFSALERDHESQMRDQVLLQMQEFFEENSCVNDGNVFEMNSLLEDMKHFGVVIDRDGQLVNQSNWDIRAAIFVSLQLIATIGFPVAAPQSDGGRAFAVPFAILGIPLFLVTAIGMGAVLNGLAEWLRNLCASKCCDPCAPECGPRFFRTIFILLFGVVFFILIPSLIFVQIEPWTYGDAFYFCFITLATVGFGDLVPSYNDVPWMSDEYRNWYRLAIAFWILLLSVWFAGVLVSVQTSVTRAALTTESKLHGNCENEGSQIWSSNENCSKTEVSRPHLILNRTTEPTTGSYYDRQRQTIQPAFGHFGQGQPEYSRSIYSSENSSAYSRRLPPASNDNYATAEGPITRIVI